MLDLGVGDERRVSGDVGDRDVALALSWMGFAIWGGLGHGWILGSRQVAQRSRRPLIQINATSGSAITVAAIATPRTNGKSRVA